METPEILLSCLLLLFFRNTYTSAPMRIAAMTQPTVAPIIAAVLLPPDALPPDTPDVFTPKIASF